MGDPYLLLGVMSNPWKGILRHQWVDWAGTFSSTHRQTVKVRYVFGETVYQQHVDPGQATEPAGNASETLFVKGREKLPHVGVVTEKSATFWQSAASREPSARWFCKCDGQPANILQIERFA